jgi:hypothetical protein
VIFSSYFSLCFGFSCCVLFLKQLQVKHLDTSEKSELYKLRQLKDEQGMEIPIH